MRIAPWKNLQQRGDVTLEINFRAGPGQNLTAVVWSEFEALFISVAWAWLITTSKINSFRPWGTPFCIKCNDLYQLCDSLNEHRYEKDVWN